jgi:HD-GYP domain-containing protein (c-di-GMP phosphodiesterase class II)
MNSEKQIIEITGIFQRLNEIGIALSTEKDINKLLELILVEAKQLTHADAGTLYMLNENNQLQYEIMQTDSLNFRYGGTSSTPVPNTIQPVKLYISDSEVPNYNNVSAYAALTGKTINVEDAYIEKGFDFSGPKEFDKVHNYRSKSFLTVPMKNHENDVIGVLQLINAQIPNTNEITTFDAKVQKYVESLASQAAVALTNQNLVIELQKLLEGFIISIADSIDRKSKHTGQHCRNVPKLTLMIADKVAKSQVGKYKDFVMNKEQRYELETASWLHDCGKVTTPVHIVNKSTKLEKIYDRIETIKTKFEILKRDTEIVYLKAINELDSISDKHKIQSLHEEFKKKVKQYDDDFHFLNSCNLGAEYMKSEDVSRINDISNYQLILHNNQERILSQDEVKNLSIPAGTLTNNDRIQINDHIIATIEMLEKLPFPKHLKNVSRFAGGHHERIDGKGYPKGLNGDTLCIEARMMAIADVFEALTAPDRPYKQGYRLSKAVSIIVSMAGNHLDKDLVKVFLEEKIYNDYAVKFMHPSQIDEVDLPQMITNLKING